LNELAHQHGLDDGLRELALFAGAGGGILGGKLLGWRTVCAVEIEPYAASVLVARQNDGILPPFPIWDDVCTFDGKPWRGIVDVVSGGFPCQDISSAGKGAGITGERSGLWKEFARIIREVEPRFVFVENSPVLTSRGLGVVLGDLASMGYDAKWGIVSAANAGAPHQRERIWVLATDSNMQSRIAEQKREYERPEKLTGSGKRELESFIANACSEGRREIASGSYGNESSDDWRATEQYNVSSSPGASRIQTAESGGAVDVAYANEIGRRQVDQSNFSRAHTEGATGKTKHSSITTGWPWWSTEPDVGRVAHGVAARVDRLKAIGNGQVSAVAELAWKTLTAAL